MRGRAVDFCINANPVAPKLVTLNKLVLRAGMGSCLPRLKCKRNARCVAVADSFVLINVSSSSIHDSERNEKPWHYEAEL